MSSIDSNDKPTPPEANHHEIQAAPPKAISPRKLEANRQNALHSTGPQTPEGKEKSSRNAVSHGIFVKHFLNGAAPETIEEIEALTAGLQKHFEPANAMEEILMGKVIVETVRYGRVLRLEQQELARKNIFYHPAVDRVGRYTTSTSRALFHAIDQLERIQGARRARESAAESSSPKSDDDFAAEIVDD